MTDAVVGEALLFALGQGLGAAWTDDVKSEFDPCHTLASRRTLAPFASSAEYTVAAVVSTQYTMWWTHCYTHCALSTDRCSVCATHRRFVCATGAWGAVYGVVSATMIAGAEYPKEVEVKKEAEGVEKKEGEEKK